RAFARSALHGGHGSRHGGPSVLVPPKGPATASTARALGTTSSLQDTASKAANLRAVTPSSPPRGRGPLRPPLIESKRPRPGPSEVRSLHMAAKTDWNPILRSELDAPYLTDLQQFVASHRAR